VATELRWYGHYDQALALIEEGRAGEARQHLEAAAEQRGEPGRLVRTYGLRYVDYLPYLYLAVVSHMEGDLEAARGYLETSERWGVAQQTEVGSTLLPAYRILLQTSDLQEAEVAQQPPVPERVAEIVEAEVDPTEAAKPSYKVYEPRSTVISEREVEEVRTDVRRRCGISSDLHHSRLPWYFHYEMGLAMERRGDPQRALDALVAAAENRPVSQHGARMYGMWFTDYMPYFAIARAHANLGNWSCALDALEVSEDMGEVVEEDDEYAEFRALMAEVKENSKF
jgi:hypothetical protein